MKHGILRLIFYTFIVLQSSSIKAELSEGQIVTIQFLDKITAKIENIDVEVDTTFNYGTLIIEVYACYKRPPEEIPEDFALLRVFDLLEQERKKIFQGWMISSSPSATPFEHPIYDVSIKECKF